MSKFILNIKFLPGTSLKEAIIEAKEKAQKLDMAYVCFRWHDGTVFYIGKHANIDAVIREYKERPLTKFPVVAS